MFPLPPRLQYFLNSSSIKVFLNFCFFLAEIDRTYHKLSFETSLVEMEHICWEKTKTCKKI